MKMPHVDSVMVVDLDAVAQAFKKSWIAQADAKLMRREDSVEDRPIQVCPRPEILVVEGRDVGRAEDAHLAWGSRLQLLDERDEIRIGAEGVCYGFPSVLNDRRFQRKLGGESRETLLLRDSSRLVAVPCSRN